VYDKDDDTVKEYSYSLEEAWATDNKLLREPLPVISVDNYYFVDEEWKKATVVQGQGFVY
jgi:hypothetical protein